MNQKMDVPGDSIPAISNQHPPRAGLPSRSDIASIREAYRAAGKSVGFTSGVFDLLHAGHVQYLEDASRLVDVLIIGVNSDVSVRSNKGPDRPINSERDRLRIVAALRACAHAFVFDELNNNANVEILRPDVYIKAGDYRPEKLTSKAIVESYGGRVEIVPMRAGLSTTALINRIQGSIATSEGEQISRELRPAVFVDRDGTMIEHVEYLSDPSNVREIPGAFQALANLRRLGFRIVVVTNQPGIGLGYFSKEDFYRVNREMMRQATAAGLMIDKIYFCPHSKSDGCRCRKPGTYLIDVAARDLNLDVASSFVIGDMTSDLELARAAGAHSVLVKTGQAGKDKLFEVQPELEAETIKEACEEIAKRASVDADLTKHSQVTVKTAASSDLPLLENMGKFAAAIGHDYNNIFGSVLACVDLLRQRTSGDSSVSQVNDVLKILDRAVAKGLSLSNKMRGFARPGVQKKTSVALRSCVESVIDIIRTSRGDGVIIEMVCDQDIEVEIADFTVAQVLLQLCENSIEAMQHLTDKFLVFNIGVANLSDDASRLELAPGRYGRISLADHGKGIEADQKEAVFQPFFSTKSRGVGKGLGLSMSMAKAVMKQHGGTITLASTKGVGTVITLYFPIDSK